MRPLMGTSIPMVKTMTPAQISVAVSRGTKVEATNTKLADNQKRNIEIISAARLQGTLPPREKLQPLDQERQAIVMTGLQNVQNQISTEGWHVVERFMRDSGGAVMIRLTKPPK